MQTYPHTTHPLPQLLLKETRTIATLMSSDDLCNSSVWYYS